MAQPKTARDGSGEVPSGVSTSPDGGLLASLGIGGFAADPRGAAAATYLLHVLHCSFSGETPRPLPEGCTWERVHALAAWNSLEGASWFGAERADDVPDDLRRRWQAEADGTLYRRMLFDVEREGVLEDLHAAGVSTLPLKGVNVAPLYPRPEMRSMADNDLLYGFVEPDSAGGFRVRGATGEERGRSVDAAREAVVRVMETRGYETASQEKGNHESFLKKPVYNFELHRALARGDTPMARYYASPWTRARLERVVGEVGGSAVYELRFSPEDEYVYLIAHAFKHFDGSGCGIRILLDVKVFLDAYAGQLDMAYVAEQLEALEMADFERALRRLSEESLGEGRDPEDEMLALLLYMVGSGTYGTSERYMDRKMARLSKGSGRGRAAFLRDFFFPDEGWLEINMPFYHRHRWARPLVPLARVRRFVGYAVKHPAAQWSKIKRLLGR